MKKVGILGSGIVGQTLGRGFIKYGYAAMIGTRETEKLDEWKSKNGVNASLGSPEDAAKFGDILVLAVKGTVAEEVMKQAGLENFNGKTVIDTTNPIVQAPAENGVLKYFTTLDDSLMERLQRLAPQARFVKAFCQVGNAYMVDPVFPGGKPTMFYCGNNENAKAEVKEILELFGHDAEDMGKAEAARAIEPLCMLWCIPGFIRNQWTHAFKLLKM
jgi:8-hydroxy-5-deazaflavin:NADPH oxidoreductase